MIRNLYSATMPLGGYTGAHLLRTSLKYTQAESYKNC